MSIEEYKNKIRGCDNSSQLSSLIGIALADDELSLDEYQMVSQMILDKLKRLDAYAKEREALQKTRERMR